MAYKAHERLHFGVSAQWQTLSNQLQVLLGGPNPLLTHVVSQIVDLRFKHIAFRQLQFEAMLPQVIKDHTHSQQMLFRRLQENTSSK